MYKVKVVFNFGVSMLWNAKNFDSACELWHVLSKKYRNAKSIEIVKS